MQQTNLYPCEQQEPSPTKKENQEIPQDLYTQKIQRKSSNIFPNNLQTLFVTVQNFYTQNFTLQQFILLILFLVNSIVYFNFKKDAQKVILSQIFISLVNGFIVLNIGITQTTLSLLLVIIATVIAVIITPLYHQIRQFIFIPLLYLTGFKGVKRKSLAIYRALQKESIYMFLSISLLFYVVGYISYFVFWKNQRNFKTPINASLSLLQVVTFESFGQITSRVSAVSGLAASFSILLSTLVAFQLLYNINQALIIKYVQEQQATYNVTHIFQSLFSIYGIQINVDEKILRNINIIITSIVFFIPFQPQFAWLYCILTVISTITIFLYEFGKGNIFGKRSILSVLLFVSILLTFYLQIQHVCFLLCCFRILLIKEILDLWKKIKKVVQKVYPMLSLLIANYVMFAMLIFTLQQQSLQNTFITSIQMLTLDDWSSHIRNYPWYMKIILLSYMLIGSHLLVNSLVSLAFNQLQDTRQLSVRSRLSNSYKQYLNQLPPQKIFVNILKQLKFQCFNQFQKQNNFFFQAQFQQRNNQSEQEQYQQYQQQIDSWNEMKQQQIVIDDPQNPQKDINFQFKNIYDQNINNNINGKVNM